MIRILHVEDEVMEHELFSTWMEKLDADMQITWSSNVFDALEILETETFDAIVCDYQISDSDGLCLLKSLRGLGNEQPVIFLTGVTKDEIIQAAMKLGAAAYHIKSSKPEDFHRLMNSIRALVRGAQQSTSNLSLDIPPA